MSKRVVVVGAGPAGLMAAEVLVTNGFLVSVYDAMPSAGRKFLQAGRGGLNITHSQPVDEFVHNYYEASNWLAPMIRGFNASAIQVWMKELGIDGFVGSSGRIFPGDKKAAPLLRAWLHRLKQAGVVFYMKHRFIGWNEESLLMTCPDGQSLVQADAFVMALGGASWPQLGARGDWLASFAQKGIDVAPFRPANCSFNVAWSHHLIQRYAGAPIKPVTLHYHDYLGRNHQHQGELILSASGLEGGLIYRFSSLLRDAIELCGTQTIHLDLLPGLNEQQALNKLNQASARLSLSNKLKSSLHLSAVKIGLVQEWIKQHNVTPNDASLVQLLKRYPVSLVAVGDIAQAISSAGGVKQTALNEKLMLTTKPGVFCVGEMLDWEAPTGGYLLTASLATARWGALGVTEWLK